MDQLTQQFYDTANEIVGNVGESTQTLYAITGEPYTTFAVRFSKDKHNILSIWQNWIAAYKEFVKFKKYQGLPIYKKNDLFTIYWGMLPEIQKDPDFPDYENLIACLLISTKKSKPLYTAKTKGLMNHLTHLYHRIMGYIKPFNTKDAVWTATWQYKPSYQEILSQWHSMEGLDEQRVIPYGIPIEIYLSMLTSDYFDRPITLFPEHAEYA